MLVTMPDVGTGTPQCGLDRVIGPFAQARDRLDTITVVGRRAAVCMIAEIGWTCRYSPLPRTWRRGRAAVQATTSPAANAARASPLGNRWFADVLTECAWAARSRDSYLSAQFWRLARRIGRKKATIAVGHSILVIAWRPPGQPLRPFRPTRHRPPASRAVAQLQALGYRVVLEPVAA